MERGGGNEKEGTERKRKGRDVGRKVRYRKEREGGKGRRGMGWNLPPSLQKFLWAPTSLFTIH